jgi:uncharacterized protein YneF (UPF0154 family)
VSKTEEGYGVCVMLSFLTSRFQIIYLYIYLPIYLPTYLHIHPPTYLHIHPPTSLFIYLPTYLSIYPPTHPPTKSTYIHKIIYGIHSGIFVSERRYLYCICLVSFDAVLKVMYMEVGVHVSRFQIRNIEMGLRKTKKISS